MRMTITDLHDQVKSIEVANKKEGIVFTNFLCEQKYGKDRVRTVAYCNAYEIAACIVSTTVRGISPYIPIDNYRYNSEQKKNLLKELKKEEEVLKDKIARIQMTAKIIQRKKYILKTN